MSDHEELADAQEEQADRLEQESRRIGGHVDEARQALERANNDGLVANSLGRRDPGFREPAPSDEEDAGDGDDVASAEGPSGDETASHAEEPQGDDTGRGDETP